VHEVHDPIGGGTVRPGGEPRDWPAVTNAGGRFGVLLLEQPQQNDEDRTKLCLKRRPHLAADGVPIHLRRRGLGCRLLGMNRLFLFDHLQQSHDPRIEACILLQLPLDLGIAQVRKVGRTVHAFRCPEAA